MNLETATELRVREPRVGIKLLSKKKSTLDKQDAKKVGDSEVVVEFTASPELAGQAVTFVVVTPSGESPPRKLLVDDDIPVVQEKEPNDGFRQAQRIQVPQVVEGVIGRPLDVDVFRLEGTAGELLVVEVEAARHGSVLDSFVTFHDAAGSLLASNDDSGGTPDSRLEVVLPTTGAYYVSVLDAHDLGEPGTCLPVTRASTLRRVRQKMDREQRTTTQFTLDPDPRPKVARWLGHGQSQSQARETAPPRLTER